MADSDTHATVQEPQLTASRPASPVAGSSRDGLGAQIQDVRPTTPPPINAPEVELQNDNSAVPTEAPQVQPESDPLFQWDHEPQQGIKQGEQAEEAPATPQPKMKFKAALATPSTKSGPGESPSPSFISSVDINIVFFRRPHARD